MKTYIIEKFQRFILESEEKKETYESKEEILNQFSSLIEDPSIMNNIKSIFSKKPLNYCQGFLDGWVFGSYPENEDSIKDSIERSNDIEYNTGLKDGFDYKSENK